MLSLRRRSICATGPNQVRLAVLVSWCALAALVFGQQWCLDSCGVWAGAGGCFIGMHSSAVVCSQAWSFGRRVRSFIGMHSSALVFGQLRVLGQACEVTPLACTLTAACPPPSFFGVQRLQRRPAGQPGQHGGHCGQPARL